MYTFKILLSILILVFGLIIILFSVFNKKPLRTLIFNAFLGLGIHIIINLTSYFTNIYIPLNLYTVVGTSVFGIPAIFCFLILNLLI